MRFIHAADVHLGAPLRGLELQEGAPIEKIRSAAKRAFEGLIDYCLEEQIDLLLIAGDLFDGKAGLDTQMFVERELHRFSQAGGKTVLLRGNHDAASKQALHYKLPEGAHELPVKKADSIPFPELGVVVHGRGFDKQHTTDSLVDEYPAARDGVFNIGMLHTSASGRSEHEVYAPCTLDDLKQKGYDYWALGHIHIREELCSDPWIIFSGCLQGRHAGETGAKGATLVEVEDGAIVGAPKHIDFDVVRWHTVEIDATGTSDAEELVDKVGAEVASLIAPESDDRDLEFAVRVEVGGRTALHRTIQLEQATIIDRIIQQVASATEYRAWCGRVRFHTRPEIPPLEQFQEREDMVGDVARSFESSVRALMSEDVSEGSLAVLSKKVPKELLEGEDALEIPLLNPNVDTTELMDAMQQDLMSRIAGSEEVQ